MQSRFDYTILNIVENAIRSIKASPLVLGGIAGSGGGIGGPTGGYVGWLPQTRVAYDYSELATLDTPLSGMSLLDNLNHIRYRLQTVESGLDYITESGTFLDLYDTPDTYSGYTGKAVFVNPTEDGLIFDDVISSITVLDEGIVVSTEITDIDFVGDEIEVTASGNVATVTVTIPPLTFDPYRVVLTDSAGELTTVPEIVYESTFNNLVLGDVTDTIFVNGANTIIINGESASAGIVMESIGTSIASFFTGVRARGTFLSPTAVLDNDVLFRARGRGHDDVAISNTQVEIRMLTAEDWDASGHGTDIEFYTTPIDSTTLTKAFTIGNDGNVNIESGKTYNIDGSPHNHDDLYLQILNNLSDVDDVATARTNLGLVAGGAGDIWVEKAGDTMTGTLELSPSTDIKSLVITHPGTPTVSAIEFNDAPASLTGNIGYDGRFAFSNVSAQADLVANMGGKVYQRSSATDVYGFAAYGYLNDTTTGGRNVTGIYVEGQVHSSQNQAAASVNGIQVIAGNLAAITTTTSKVFTGLINNANASAVTTNAYGMQLQINSNTGSITNLFGIRVGPTGGTNFRSGTVTNAYGLYVNDVSGAGTLNYGIFTNAGLVRLGDQLSVVGSSDRIQERIIGNATQTSSLVTWESSGGTIYGLVGGSGLFTFGPTAGTAKVNVIGSADIVQFTVKANATQTGNIFTVENSSGGFILRLDQNGLFRANQNLLAMNTNTSAIFLGASAQRAISIRNTDSTTGAFSSLDFEDQSGTLVVSVGFKQDDLTNHYGSMTIGTKGASGFAARMTIASTGNLGVGVAPTAISRFAVRYSASTTGSTAIDARLTGTASVAELQGIYGLISLTTANNTQVGTSAPTGIFGAVGADTTHTHSEVTSLAAFVSGSNTSVMTVWNGVKVHTPSLAGGSTITTAYGLFVSDQTAGGTNYAIRTNIGRISVLGSTTIASAAGATWGGIEERAATATITGSTNITTAAGFNYHSIAQPTLSAASALTVTNSATLYIANAPTGAGAGPATITNAYALWVDAGNSRFDGGIELQATNIVTDTTTGMKVATATAQKLGFWNATPIVQPTTAITAATFVANTSAIADDTATFDGYTIGQIVKALRNSGLLA